MSLSDNTIPFFAEVQDSSRNLLHKFGEKFFKIEGTSWGRSFKVVQSGDRGGGVSELTKSAGYKGYLRNGLRLLGTITLLPMMIALVGKLAHRSGKTYTLITIPKDSAKQTEKVASEILTEKSTPLQEYLKEQYPDFAGNNARELQAMGQPLHFAAHSKEWPLLQLLIDDGADLLQKDTEGKSVLQLILSMPRNEYVGQAAILNQLMQADPEALVEFISGCTGKDDAWLEKLLPGWMGTNLVPIMHAVLENQELKKTKKLILTYIEEGKIDVDASINPEKVNMSMLYKAANRFDLALFVELLKLKADPLLATGLTNPPRPHNIGPATPLECLVRRWKGGHEDLLFAILTNYIGKTGSNIMHELLDNPNLDRKKVYAFLDGTNNLDVSASDPNGLTLLWKALGRKDYELCRWLVKKGASLTQQGDRALADSTPQARIDALLEFAQEPNERAFLENLRSTT